MKQDFSILDLLKLKFGADNIDVAAQVAEGVSKVLLENDTLMRLAFRKLSPSRLHRISELASEVFDEVTKDAEVKKETD